jgi:hypothetical protein
VDGSHEREVTAQRHLPRTTHDGGRPRPSGRWLTTLAFAVVAVPFAFAVLRLATAPTANLTLPDDLALIDLHVRRALVWKQQLGVFDHNNWNHPGPTYFYLLSLAYRVLGSSARSLFVGATILNALSAVACVAVVRRRTTPTRALWAALWLTVLAGVLAAGGTAATTYSESVLGALASPWNPMVVLFPLLLLVLLCAGAIDRSAPSLVGALLVGSFVIQTDISTTPLALALVGVAGLVWLVTVALDSRGRVGQPSDPPAVGTWTPGRWSPGLVGGGLVALALMWLLPVVQQFTNHPGNLTLIEQFFRAGHPGQTLSASLWSVTAAAAVLVVGPSEVMGSILGGTQVHAGLAVAVSLATVVLATAVAVAGARQRSRFAFGTGVLTLVGIVASVAAVTHVVGFIFGYLVVWAVVLPVAALIGAGTVRIALPTLSSGPRAAVTGVRVALAVVAVAVIIVTCTRVAAIPSLDHAGDPRVGQLAALVVPRVAPGQRIAVGDAGAGTVDTRLLDTEEFIGLVDLLDRSGYRPTVNDFWKAQFGPGFRTDGTEPRVVGLSTWTPRSPDLRGYVGHVGDMAVTVTDRSGAPVPAAG